MKFDIGILASQPLPVIVEQVRLAETLGFDTAWIADTHLVCRELWVVLTACAAAAYFLVWALSGALIFATGIVLANVEMQLPAIARLVPTLAGLVLLVAGALQLSRWKERHLEPRCAGSNHPGADLRDRAGRLCLQ